jgi:hypothetical protein
MSQSHKSKWQKALAKSGLGHRAIGTGLAMSLYANEDGTRMFPSMRTLAEEMGCDKKYVTEGRRTLTEYDWLAFVAKGIPGQKGDEFTPTFGRCHRSLSGTHEAVAIGPFQEGDRSVSAGDRSVSEARQVPERVITMTDTMVPNHERHHDPTAEPTGDAAWAKVEADAKAEAAVLAEVMAKAPSFD